MQTIVDHEDDPLLNPEHPRLGQPDQVTSLKLFSRCNIRYITNLMGLESGSVRSPQLGITVELHHHWGHDHQCWGRRALCVVGKGVTRSL